MEDFSAVPEDSRGPLSKVIGNGMAKLKPVADTVLNKEGVGDVIGPVMSTMMEKLGGMVK